VFRISIAMVTIAHFHTLPPLATSGENNLATMVTDN